jgi:hypothetical protein
MSSWRLMILRISWSSTALSSAASISPLPRLSRASFSGAVRSRLPTMSARNGGAFRGMDISLVFESTGSAAFGHAQVKRQHRLVLEQPTRRRVVDDRAAVEDHRLVGHL